MHVCPVCPALVRGYVQVPLMAALPTAQAALNAHRGVAAVAEQGLGFLRGVAFAEANQVIWWARFGVSLFACMHAQCALRLCVAVCRCR